jgi:ABC-2 type transport system ATP-binding protein
MAGRVWYNASVPGLAIETHDLVKRFPLNGSVRRMFRRGRAGEQQEVTAVDGVSLAVEQGELFGLLGPNGAGKTTLIKLLCTLVVPTSGSARIGGVDLNHSEQVRGLVGMASGDERSFYWRLTARENLAFFAALYGLDKQTAARRVEELLQQVGLAAQADRPFRTYSSGQKQRLSIARALLHGPRVLFLDEPTRSLDPTATMNLHRFIEEELLGRQGMTILLTTHRLDEAQRLCQRVAIMHAGRIRACGTPDELKASLGPTVAFILRARGLEVFPEKPYPGLMGQVTVEAGEEPGEWLVRLDAVEGEEALGSLIQEISQAGGRVVDMTREQPSLEQVFQRFTEQMVEG